MTLRVVTDAELATDAALDQLYAEHGGSAPADLAGLRDWATQFRKPLTALVIDGLSGYDAAVLLTATKARGVTTVRLAGHGWADIQAVPARSAEASGALAAGLREWLDTLGAWRVELEQLPADDPFVIALVAENPQLQWREGDPLPYAEWPQERTDVTWARKKFRQQSRQSMQRLVTTGGGEVSFVSFDQPTDLADRLSAYDELFVQRERSVGRPSAMQGAPTARLKHDTVLRLAQSGRIQAWELRAGPALLAYYVAVRDDAGWRMWDGRMSPDWTRFVPGSLLMSHVLQTWHADPTVHRVDFMRGSTEFKRRISTGMRATAEVRLWSSSGLQRRDLLREQVDDRSRTLIRRARDRSHLVQRAATALQSRRTVR